MLLELQYSCCSLRRQVSSKMDTDNLFLNHVRMLLEKLIISSSHSSNVEFQLGIFKSSFALKKALSNFIKEICQFNILGKYHPVQHVLQFSFRAFLFFDFD
mgnify:CR=1 FL=1